MPRLTNRCSALCLSPLSRIPTLTFHRRASSLHHPLIHSAICIHTLTSRDVILSVVSFMINSFCRVISVW